MNEHPGTPLSEEPPADTDVEDDDLVEGADDLPADVPNDDLATDEPPGADPVDVDTDVDAPVVGTPDEGDIDGPTEPVIL